MGSDAKPRPKRPPWRVIGALWLVGVAAVVVGLFVSPALIAFGALFVLVAPFLFLFAAPAPPERKHDPMGEALSLAITRAGRLTERDAHDRRRSGSRRKRWVRPR